MINRDLVMTSLQRVEDPELHKSLIELDMVRDVRIDGNKVAVVVNLTIKVRSPLTSTIRCGTLALYIITIKCMAFNIAIFNFFVF